MDTAAPRSTALPNTSPGKGRHFAPMLLAMQSVGVNCKWPCMLKVAFVCAQGAATVLYASTARVSPGAMYFHASAEAEPSATVKDILLCGDLWDASMAAFEPVG